MAHFEDFVIKLMVIDRLTYKKVIVTPYENAHQWLMAERGIDISAADALIHGEYFAKRIPEIEQWARELEITDEQLEQVDTLLYDGGLSAFMLLSPSWDGEDDLYRVRTWADVTKERFPQLEKLTVVGPIDTMADAAREGLESAGVIIEVW
ncbi:MAG: DUF6892 domain-containing protein [Gulosibacter sp.]|uniref:DUF6892 domain-containing protein n=1 Tax=Gulosibacter sp. TaxID=2817531 RepID=UPI003F93BE27